MGVWLDHYYYHTFWHADTSTRFPACEWCVAASGELLALLDQTPVKTVLWSIFGVLDCFTMSRTRLRACVYGSISILSVDWAQSSTCRWLQVMIMVTILLSKALDCSPNNTWASWKQARQPLFFLCCSVKVFLCQLELLFLISLFCGCFWEYAKHFHYYLWTQCRLPWCWWSRERDPQAGRNLAGNGKGIKWSWLVHLFWWLTASLQFELHCCGPLCRKSFDSSV